MSRVPPEPPSWSPAPDAPDPDDTARQLREQVDAAKTRIRKHLELLRAADLATPDRKAGSGDDDGDKPG